MTISPTMMETFESLAQCDVAIFLYQQLKYFDDFDTTYAQLQLKLDTLQSWADRREDLVNKLDEAHTTTANFEQSMIICT